MHAAIPARTRARLPPRTRVCKDPRVQTRIITVAAAKGGVGKTTLAYELAAALDAVLVDLDWDAGGATRMWGYAPERYVRAPLLDALERGPTGAPPRPRSRPHQPRLVPAHPDLSASRIDPELVAECLAAWADAWDGDYVVVDTHPGANALTDGAIQVADLLVMPVVLGAREMDALAASVADFADYRLLLVPMMVPPVPPRRFVERLEALAGGEVAVAPPVSEHRWIRRRLRRAALVRQPSPGVRVRAAAAEFRAVARTVEESCG
jgi:chromosome partitioning protein